MCYGCLSSSLVPCSCKETPGISGPPPRGSLWSVTGWHRGTNARPAGFRWDRSLELSTPCSSLGIGIGLWLDHSGALVTPSPASLTPITPRASPENTSSVNLVHQNPHFRLCFEESPDLRPQVSFSLVWLLNPSTP